MAETRRPFWRRTARGVDRTVKRAVGKVGQVLISPLDLAGHLLPRPQFARRQPGAPPGIEQIAETRTPPAPGSVHISVLEYGRESIESREVAIEELDTELFNKPIAESVNVRWVNIDGLNPYLVRQFMERYDLHTLAAEDVLNVPQRPKVEPYDQTLFVVGRMIMLRDRSLHSEQTSFFLQGKLLITFQETRGDVWEPVRDRINTPGLKIRRAGADYLLYALLDAMIDHTFPLLEAYSEDLEELEGPIMARPHQRLLQRVHRIKRELAVLRRVAWPMREVADALYRDEHGFMQADTRPFLRDVYDHCVQALDIIENYREIATGLGDLYMNAVSHRMNEVMKVLTIMGTIFIPLSFIAGVWGMNFQHMPELHRDWMYPWGFWGLCGTVVVGLLVFFRSKRWL